ncbi:hypothetical protein [Pasteurella multocida]|uniref:hypothetical protein n=1 Tax=Pasteurella multocida TaxID=747 RepID=UPI002B4BA093|nr:hypothetical protein [Pasteurella multocida]
MNKALFLEVLEQGVRLWNDKAGRETELGQGIFSHHLARKWYSVIKLSLSSFLHFYSWNNP